MSNINSINCETKLPGVEYWAYKNMDKLPPWLVHLKQKDRETLGMLHRKRVWRQKRITEIMKTEKDNRDQRRRDRVLMFGLWELCHSIYGCLSLLVWWKTHIFLLGTAGQLASCSSWDPVGAGGHQLSDEVEMRQGFKSALFHQHLCKRTVFDASSFKPPGCFVFSLYFFTICWISRGLVNVSGKTSLCLY